MRRRILWEVKVVVCLKPNKRVQITPLEISLRRGEWSTRWNVFSELEKYGVQKVENLMKLLNYYHVHFSILMTELYYS